MTGSRLISLILVSTALAVAQGAELPTNRLVGQRLSNFSLVDAVTKDDISLYGYLGKRGVVLVFVGVDCPVGNLYMPRLVELNERYKDQGIVFLAVNSNKSESIKQVAEHAKQFGLNLPVLKDKDGRIADMALVERTNEVLLLDRRSTVRYRGAIDNQYTQTGKKPEATKTYLVDALDALLAGREIEVKATEVSGCPIERSETTVKLPKPTLHGPSEELLVEWDKRSGKVEVGKVTFAGEVASILQNKCQECHRPGQPAPFSLLTYDDARRWAGSIAEVVEERRMPPWHADPRYGHFSNDRSLSAKDRSTLLAWVEQGTPLGDPTKVPAAKKFPEGWAVGEPDIVFEIPEPFNVPRQGTVEYVQFRVPTNFKEDVWVQAAEARPSDRAVVHHIIVYLEEPKKPGEVSRGRDGMDRTHFCGYAPGDMPSIFPPGVGKLIPAGTVLLFEIHYTPDGKSGHADKSKLGLIFTKKPPKYEAYTTGVAQTAFTLPARAPNHEVVATYTFKDDIHIMSFMPHMHLRGKSFKYTAKYPDGKTEILLDVPAYDFAWQSYYTVVEPKKIPKGTVLECVAHFDNSTDNQANPAPHQAVRWGNQTFEEMMIGYIDIYYDEPIGGKPHIKMPPLLMSESKIEPTAGERAFRNLLQGGRGRQPLPQPKPAPVVKDGTN